MLLSCESRLYPPTYPPVLSDIILTSTSSIKTSTDSVYMGDTVFISVTVDDPEDDPETLNVDLQSAGISILSSSVSSSRIFDGTVWETWIETDQISAGDYTLVLTATDSEGNVGDPVGAALTVTNDIQALVTTADIVISGVSYALKDAVPDEPFTLTFSVTNNSIVEIDRINVPFTVTMRYDNSVDPPSLEYYSGNGILTSLGGGETKTGYLRLNIQNADRTYVSEPHAEADCTLSITDRFPNQPHPST